MWGNTTDRPAIDSDSMSFLILTLWGCSAFDTERSAAVQYLEAVQPLMVENRLLTDETLSLAALVHDEAIPEDGLALRWSSTVVPLSQHLRGSSASQIDPPPEWSDLRANLTSIWADRAVAYRDMGDAIVLADESEWTAPWRCRRT